MSPRSFSCFKVPGTQTQFSKVNLKNKPLKLRERNFENYFSLKGFFIRAIHKRMELINSSFFHFRDSSVKIQIDNENFLLYFFIALKDRFSLAI